jgi:M6 family metalloprotease-like protein
VRQILLPLLLLCSVTVFTAEHPETQRCGTHPSAAVVRPAEGDGGIYLPSSGVLRVLVIFASFPDDSAAHASWPVRQPPLFMQNFIDPDTTTRSTNTFNLTNYFRQMSGGKFHVIGDAIWAESPASQEVYRNSGSYGNANMLLLPQVVDPVVDFTPYDNWTRTANYTFVNEPDGIVDMIFVVWRTTMWQYLGEASLGYKPAIPVDGKRIEMGYPGYYPQPIGSGVTCEYPYGDSPNRVLKTMVHEMSHWLLGIFHPYNGGKPDGKYQYWGMLCTGERLSGCANTYDRERLGWITPQTILPGQTVVLRDFVTTGDAAKFHPPGGEPDEYLYLENHQGVSGFDDVTAEPGDRGVWILHQEGPYIETDNLRILPSDGDWHWSAAKFTTSCFSRPMRLYKREAPDVIAGLSHRDQIPNPGSIVDWMFAYQNEAGEVICGGFPGGAGFRGAFDTAGARVFSPSSNPAALTWARTSAGFSFEVIRDSGGTISLLCPSDPATLSPARRFLGAVPGIALPGTHAVAWGTAWPKGQSLEADVVSSELQRVVGDGIGWSTVYSGPALTWTDSTLRYDSTGSILVRFRVRMIDSQGKISAWSAEHVTRASTNTAVSVSVPVERALLANFPNPFNPSTTIEFSVRQGGWTSVDVLDVLGKKVRTLYDNDAMPGSHRIQWDGLDDQGRAVAAGVYFCRLTADRATLTRAMMLLK